MTDSKDQKARNIRLDAKKWQALKLEAFRRGIFMQDYIDLILSAEVERIKKGR